MLTLRSGILPLLTVSLLGLGMNIPKAQAQTVFNLNSDYDYLTSVTTFPEINLTRGVGDGSSDNAQFGLSKFNNVIYSRFSDVLSSLETGKPFNFDSDPTVLGLVASPGNITFFGEGNDKLVGTLNGTNTFNKNAKDLTTSTLANFTITGGEGKFTGAKGTGKFVGSFSSDPSVAVNKGKVSLSATFVTPQSIPESMNALPIAFCVLGASFLLKKSVSSLKITQKNSFRY